MFDGRCTLELLPIALTFLVARNRCSVAPRAPFAAIQIGGGAIFFDVSGSGFPARFTNTSIGEFPNGFPNWFPDGLVARERVRINAGSGASAEVWSFAPPDSADAWTEAIRAVIKGSDSRGRAPGP